MDKFKKLLLERQRDLTDLAESARSAKATVELDQSRVGRLSRMDALQAQAMAKETDRRRGVELRRIEAALARLENDEFGYCLACGDEIARARLDHDPSTPLCIDCANKAESRG